MIETRFSTDFDADLLLRAEGDGATLRIFGVAVPWDRLSAPLMRDSRTGKPVRERFMPGAFSAILAEPGVDILALREHDLGRLLGRTSSGTLKVTETIVGLEYALDPPDTEEGRELVTLSRRGDLRGSSFSFGIAPGGIDFEERADELVRTVTKARILRDVSPVTRPAYAESTLSARSASLEMELVAWRKGGADALDIHYQTVRLIAAGF